MVPDAVRLTRAESRGLVAAVAHAVIEAVPAGGVALGLVVGQGGATHDVARLRRTRPIQEGVARTIAAARRGAVVAFAAAWVLVVEGPSCRLYDGYVWLRIVENQEVNSIAQPKMQLSWILSWILSCIFVVLKSR